MKNGCNGALRCNRKPFAIHQSWYGVACNTVLLFGSLLLTGFLFTGCQKQLAGEAAAQAQLKANNNQLMANGQASSGAELMNMYSGLGKQTMWELQQARAATARYRDIRNAIKDGYSNINVDVENMGHHFMNRQLVDGTFDVRKPEILVYNGLDEGNPQLVAVEYAINYFDGNGNVTPRPEGFTGSGDVWKSKDETGFPFWLVHAWVWKYNPDGVFNWTNPLVDLD